MTIAHDITPFGRLRAVFDMCQMHRQMGNLRHMPGLEALLDQTDRVLRAAIREQMNAKQIEPQIKAQPRTELPI